MGNANENSFQGDDYEDDEGFDGEIEADEETPASRVGGCLGKG